MATALERLAALTGKDRFEIVPSSALVEWERTSLFQLHQGREGTGSLVEIVLSQCGGSQEDTATPLVTVVNMILPTKVGSAEEAAATAAARLAAVTALMQNKVPFEFGVGDGQDAETEGTVTYQPLDKFVGQETTRSSFLQKYVAIKAKGHEGSMKVEADDENAAPVSSEQDGCSGQED